MKKSVFIYCTNGTQHESFWALVNAVKEFGVYVYADPAWEETSEFAFFVTKKNLTKKEIREVSKMFNQQ